MSDSLRSLPTWSPPNKEGKYLTGLMLNNSMTGNKVEFIPMNDRTVLWYGCGPTVYDAAHMGHARTYISFDIIRRIMTEYFGYAITMVMNITDIDDKIILRSISDGVPFSEFARHWEQMFWQDMKSLNVLLPDVITRVSEYIPEIIAFVEKIIENGYGYQSDSSVYFDTQKFSSSDNHYYCRMEPHSVSDQTRIIQGEGTLGLISEKKCPTDFALWKKAKEGEPSWNSPWGEGRPGWHIECSAMATTILGFPIDIHSGGIDLRFPHHDNELAQCEGYCDKPQWVNYFLHSGHLHILGKKMSKSLKNFITISEALNEFSARSIRILTLMHRWDTPMDYSAGGESMREAVSVDRQFMNFFGLVKAKMRKSSINLPQKWQTDDNVLHKALTSCQSDIHSALLDNINTPLAVNHLQGLITQCNTYMKATEDGDVETSRLPLLYKCGKYIIRMLRIFGVTNGSEEHLDYVTGSVSSTDTADVHDENVVPLMECLTNFRLGIRSSAQSLVKAAKTVINSSSSDDAFRQFAELVVKSSTDNLSKCDDLRDNDLFQLGIQLEDKGSTSIWKHVPKEEMIADRKLKKDEEAQRLEQKKQLLQKEMERKAQKEAELNVIPENYYMTFHSEVYSKFDEESGIPTHTITGEAVSKSQKEKMRKFLEKHRQAHEKWITLSPS